MTDNADQINFSGSKRPDKTALSFPPVFAMGGDHGGKALQVFIARAVNPGRERVPAG